MDEPGRQPAATASRAPAPAAPAHLGAVPRAKLSEEVAARLVASILGGKFKLGERLPAERDLARYLDIGRPTLREAVMTLRAVGLIEVRHGEGMFVVNQQRDFVTRALGWVVLLDAGTAAEIREARATIEAAVAELAAQRADANDLADLEASLDQMAASLAQRKRFAAAEAGFQVSVARATRNVVLERILEALRMLARTSANSNFTDGRLERGRALEAAIATHDPAAARAAAGATLRLDQLGPSLLPSSRVAEPPTRSQPAKPPGGSRHRSLDFGDEPARRSTSPLRIGMITPSSNTMVERITAAITTPLDDQLSVHYARIPVTRISLDRPSQQQFDLDGMLAAARLLADARVHAICWNGISAAWKGAASDRFICDAIQRETGVPATSATLAQLEACRVYGIRRYALAVPYRDDVRKAIIRVFSDEGLECVNSAHLGISVNFDFAQIAPGKLQALVHQANSVDAEAIVVTCTNLATARLVDSLEVELHKPIFDSLLLSLWHPLRLLGWDRPIAGWGRVVTDLSTTNSRVRQEQ
jgi:maleate isomerase